ncbi:MAG: hypothetical protein AAGJ18_12560 [Bacteroidota bacterium]
MKKQFLLISLFFLFGLVAIQAQTYDKAIGARLGYPLSVSYKTFLNESSAVEVFAGTRGFSGYRWISLSGAYQIHKPLSAANTDGLNFYYGAGASVYFWSYDNDFIDNSSSTSIGLQGYLGLDYSLKDTPINFTVDWIHTFIINGFGSGFGAGYGSLGVRYILSR